MGKINILFDKSLEDINRTANIRLKEAGFDTSPGSVVKLISNIINKEIVDFYELLSDAHSQAFVSTATGSFLDSIAMLFDCKRKEKETDNDFRARVVQQVSKLTSCNETAIRLKILEVDGVRDVKLKKYTHGVGTFSVVPLLDSIDISDNKYLTIKEIAENATAYGNRVEVLKPFERKVAISIKLIFKKILSDNEEYSIRKHTRESLERYISNLKIGEPIIINELIHSIMDTSEHIANFKCNSFTIDGVPVNFANVSSTWNSVFVESNIHDSIEIL